MHPYTWYVLYACIFEFVYLLCMYLCILCMHRLYVPTTYLCVYVCMYICMYVYIYMYAMDYLTVFAAAYKRVSTAIARPDTVHTCIVVLKVSLIILLLKILYF